MNEKTTEEIENARAEDLMTPFVVEAHPHMNLKEVAHIMVAKDVHRLVIPSPVGRKPVGLLSASDIVKQMRRVDF